MDTGPLQMLHDSGDEDIFPVADGVYLKLLAHQILIDQNGMFLFNHCNDVHKFPDVVVVVCNFHALSAQHIGRAHQNRITKFIRRL